MSARGIVTVLGMLLVGSSHAIVACAQEAQSSTPTSAARLKLLFSGPPDIAESWGQLQFGVTPIGLLQECGPAPFTIVGGVPLADGSWEVFGRDQVQVGDSSMRVIEVRGGEAYDRITQWKLMRATTRDGVTFENVEALLETEPAAWANNFSFAYNPTARQYLLMNLKCDRSGFAYTAFVSSDGRKWAQHPEPLFYDGDAFSLFWSPPLQRFLCVSKTLQPWRKHLLDHGGPTPSLGDDSYRDRRVLMFRSSPDGLHWSPDVSLADVWNRHDRKGSIPAQFLTVPDELDPPDLEFYSANGFWYHDRAYMMVLNYAASAVLPRKHAPQLDNEWWISRDGLQWDRPARGVNALGIFPQLNRVEVVPLVAEGTIRFRVGHLLLGLPEDRLSYVASRSHAEFSTRPFVMPDRELILNAEVPSQARPFATNQAYVMVAVVNEQGEVIPGFEAEKCVIQNQNHSDIPLTWQNTSIRTLAGQTVRLRFLLRSASIFAVNESRAE